LRDASTDFAAPVNAAVSSCSVNLMPASMA
jgi:hypothetical protein